jgi:hypothetical protein
MDWQHLFRAWRLSAPLHKFGPPAAEEEIHRAEAKLGIRLPESLRTLYRFCNGGDLLAGNLRIHPLECADDDFSLVTATDAMREYHWSVPEEVLQFGGNGSEETFGIWLPETPGTPFDHPILDTGEIFDAESLAVVGTSLLPFLYYWTAYYVTLYEGETAALDALGLPEPLRSDPYDVDMPALCAWADPNLPDHAPSPYERGLDAEGLWTLFGGRRGA